MKRFDVGVTLTIEARDAEEAREKAERYVDYGFQNSGNDFLTWNVDTAHPIDP